MIIDNPRLSFFQIHREWPVEHLYSLFLFAQWTVHAHQWYNHNLCNRPDVIRPSQHLLKAILHWPGNMM